MRKRHRIGEDPCEEDDALTSAPGLSYFDMGAVWRSLRAVSDKLSWVQGPPALQPRTSRHTNATDADILWASLDKAYDVLDALLAKSGTGEQLKEDIDAAWRHLHALEEAASAIVREQLDARSNMPLTEIAELLGKLDI